MLITHKQSLIMLSITCRCILYALVSVVVPWGVALGWVRMRLGGEKSTVYSLQKARLHHWLQLKLQPSNLCAYVNKPIKISVFLESVTKDYYNYLKLLHL